MAVDVAAYAYGNAKTATYTNIVKLLLDSSFDDVYHSIENHFKRHLDRP